MSAAGHNGGGTTAGRQRSRRETLLLAAAALALQALAWAVLTSLLSARVGYGLHDLSDIPHYLSTAEYVDRGLWPYTGFSFEYPPLTLPFLLLPPRDGTLATYTYWFSLEMLAVSSVGAAIVTLTAARLWSGLGRPLAVAAWAAVTVLAAGGIALNRFDPAVGLLVAVSVLTLVSRRPVAAAVSVGLGTALKLAPVVLVPLVLLVGGRRRWVVILVAAALAAALPLVPFLLRSPGAFGEVAGYQTGRGLQIESVSATPLLIMAAFGHGDVSVTVPPGGSLLIDAPMSRAMAQAAPFLIAVLLALAYAAVWRAREALRDDARWIAPAALLALLAFLCGNKVLSPQHLLWVLPLVPLCLVGSAPGVRAAGAILLTSVALTQVEFPAMYFALSNLQTLAILVVVARNLLLVASFVVLVLSLWRARPGPSPSRTPEAP